MAATKPKRSRAKPVLKASPPEHRIADAAERIADLCSAVMVSRPASPALQRSAAFKAILAGVVMAIVPEASALAAALGELVREANPEAAEVLQDEA